MMANAGRILAGQVRGTTHRVPTGVVGLPKPALCDVRADLFLEDIGIHRAVFGRVGIPDAPAFPSAYWLQRIPLEPDRFKIRL